MPRFRFLAVGPGGELQRGVLDAPSQAAAIEDLKRAGSLPMRAEPLSGGVSRLLRLELGGGGALRRAEVAAIVRELSTMLGAGQDLDRALRFLVETAKPRPRAVLDDLRERVRNGGALAEAMATHPRSFTRLQVGLVRAGEAGGALGTTLDRLATLLERQRALVATLQSAMVYPALLLAASIGSIALLLTQVLPQFVPLFQQSGAQLPASTRALVAAGDWVSDWGLAALLAMLLAILAARAALRRPGPRLLAERVLLRVPVAGALWRETLAARLTRTMGTLLTNGVPLIGALGIAREALGSLAGAVALDAAADSARDGAGLSGPLDRARLFPPRTIHLLRLGEETAQLGPMALRAAEIHEDAVRHQVQRLVALLVPAITVVMGLAVAAIVSSLLLAMLSINDLAGS